MVKVQIKGNFFRILQEVQFFFFTKTRK